MSKLLHIDQLNFAFEKGKGILRDIDLSMDEGEILVLLGASGCGKTTLLNCIAGLETPNSGKITLGHNILFDNGSSMKTEQRPVGMVFQGNALFPHLNVADNICFGLHGRPKHQKQQILDEMLALIDMEAKAQRMPHELSGGQQQRVAIARSLARNPKLLLMDEPFSDLDESLKNRLREDVRKLLQRANRGAIIVTHDSRDAMALAGRIAVMKDGHILQVGTSEKLYWHANNHEVKRLFGEHVELDKEVWRPEEVQLIEDPNSLNMVLSCRFMGGGFQLAIGTNDQIACHIFSKKLLEIGTKVRMEIKKNGPEDSEPL